MKIPLSLTSILLLTSIGRADDLKPINVKLMLPGCCYAGSRPDKAAPGGYGRSDNMPKRITSRQGKKDSVTLVALPNETIPFRKSNQGFRLLLINRTKSQATFSASDSRLPIIQEALDSKGRWRPIEYLPVSFCGNSDHRVFLPSEQYWEFAAPTYSGKQRTRLRFVLQQEHPIYSNEFEGSINSQQFTMN
jgi:hypothetical protein